MKLLTVDEADGPLIGTICREVTSSLAQVAERRVFSETPPKIYFDAVWLCEFVSAAGAILIIFDEEVWNELPANTKIFTSVLAVHGLRDPGKERRLFAFDSESDRCDLELIVYLVVLFGWSCVIIDTSARASFASHDGDCERSARPLSRIFELDSFRRLLRLSEGQ
jgi:hypothetical protein